jgi:hypothetical protein
MVSTGKGAAGRVVYAVPETAGPAGGVRICSRHVSLLLAAGVDAALWCPTPGYAFGWFDERVPILPGAELELTDDDLLVLPELAVVPGRDPAPGARKVIFNQNHFYTFLHWSDPQQYPGWDPPPAIWTVSTESAAVLARVHPDLTLALVPNSVDTKLFQPAARRTRSITWMPRKRRHEAMLLRRLLDNDPRARGVAIRELSGLSEREVARALGETSVFVSLGAFEGFGLPVAEALASGCLVAGYPAGGGEELFEAPTAWAVPDQRPLLLAEQAVRLLDTPDADDLRAVGRQWVARRYGPEATAAPLLEAVRTARARPGASARATHPATWGPARPPV